MLGVGWSLQPDDEFLSRCAEIAERADYLEIAPETTWAPARDGALAPNGFHARFLAIARAARRPVVAHGVGMSMGSASARDDEKARQARWLARMREDQRAFEHAWWTDHLGATSLDGESTWIPMPLAMDAQRAAIVRARLDAMAEIVPDVGVENSVVCFTLGDPLAEPRFLRDVLCAPRRHLVLDLHNVFTMARNFGFDPRAWLARCDLSRVIEIHVSGGSESDPRWLPSGRTLRLDGHDGAVPEEVWALLDEVLPRCANVRGVTLERMEGTVRDRATVRALIEELERAMDAVARARLGARAERGSLPPHPTPEDADSSRARQGAGERAPTFPDPTALERVLAAAMRADDPVAALGAHGVTPVDADGVRLQALLVARLRFERLVQGSVEAARAFDDDPSAFAASFRRYHREVPMRACFPGDEARLFARWQRSQAMG